MPKRPNAAVTAHLLERVAAALTACESAGLTVKLRHGAVLTGGGYVLPTDEGWVARTLVYTEFEPVDDYDL